MKTTITAFTRSDWGPSLRTAAHAIAAAAVLAYVAGLQFGGWLHRLNDRLAAAWPARPATVAPAPAAPAAPAATLASLTVVQLRTIARQRFGSAARIAGSRIAQARKADLLACLA
jgi:hypothetical protein